MIVTPRNNQTLHIQWHDVKGSDYRLYRSLAPEGPFELIVPSTTEPYYIDEDVNLFQNGLRYYYKVEGVEGGVVVETSKGYTSGYAVQDPVANKLLYENQLVLRVMNNPQVKVLLKRREGKRCPECWNPVTKKPRYSNCSRCNGTGFIGGYHNPVKTRISRDFSQLIEFQGMLDDGRTVYSPVSAWITNYPLVSPGDIIVDVMNQRFSIERVGQRTRGQFIIRQILEIVPLEKGHPAYSVDVDWSDMI